jgi:hypothetical protein
LRGWEEFSHAQRGFGVAVSAVVSRVPYCIFAAVGIRFGLARGVI